MGKFQDLTGRRFGNLTALEMAGRNRAGKIQWLCRCDCGNEVVRVAGVLVHGHATSCGCMTAENRRRASMAARKTMEQKKNIKTESTICWDCIRSAAPPSLQCSWDRERVLPEGADTVVYKCERISTFLIKECPQFLSIHDENNRKLLQEEREKNAKTKAEGNRCDKAMSGKTGRERCNTDGWWKAR